MGEEIPRMVEVSRARSLSTVERALLDFMFDHPDTREQLRDEADGLTVITECDCGCRSIGVLPAESTPSASYSAEESPYRLEDQVDLIASGRSAEGTRVDVILHVTSGRMVELEIWTRHLRESRGELPKLESLRHEEF